MFPLPDPDRRFGYGYFFFEIYFRFSQNDHSGTYDVHLNPSYHQVAHDDYRDRRVGRVAKLVLHKGEG